MFAAAAFSARLLWARLEALLLRVIGGPFPVPVARIRRQTVSRMGVFVFLPLGVTACTATRAGAG
jgi:hypothetical protein